MIPRTGAMLVELITSLVLLGILGVAGTALVKSQVALLRNTSERAAMDETLRTARGVLHAELRDLSPRDIRAVGGDSIALRVFRGLGIVCAPVADGVVLRYRGLRAPDPTKDSLLVVGSERSIAFRLQADQTLCVARPGEQLVTLALTDTLESGAVVLLFEAGAYHLAGRALRYRRGSEGRQPLTDELIDHDRSQFVPDSGGIRVRLAGQQGEELTAYVRLVR